MNPVHSVGALDWSKDRKTVSSHSQNISTSVPIGKEFGLRVSRVPLG